MAVQRVEALRLIAQRFLGDPVVFTCGATSREAASLERRENHLCVVDSMGLVSSITLGLGLGLEKDTDRTVVGVEGDGGMLANLNSLATIGYLRPNNLLLIVLDNESYGSTGGQATFTTRLDLTEIAAACGLNTWKVESLESLDQAISEAIQSSGPGFILMKIAPGNAPVPLLLDDPVTLGDTFTKWLGSVTAR